MESNNQKQKKPEQNATRASVYDSVESAAGKLGCEPTALRARLRRHQRRDGDAVVADLGGGIRGFKFGRNWKVLFPPM